MEIEKIVPVKPGTTQGPSLAPAVEVYVGLSTCAKKKKKYEEIVRK